MQKIISSIILFLYSSALFAEENDLQFSFDGLSDGALSTGLQMMLVMTLLTILPGIVLAMTSFTRIIIVLALTRQALGLQTTPNNQMLIGISIFLTIFIMGPILDEVNQVAVQPYITHEISIKEAFHKAQDPLKRFMLLHTRENDLNLFQNLSEGKPIDSDVKILRNEVSLSALVPAFLTSELKTSFEIGFMIFIPFLIIDLVVASILMTMGMMMLSPLVISLPFKLLLFITADGWHLLFGSLVKSFE